MTNKKFIPLEDLDPVTRVFVLSALQVLEPGSAAVFSEALRYLAGRVGAGKSLHAGEAKFLADSLLRVAADIEKYGKPFGYRARPGRPGLNALHRLALGRRVDQLHRPARYQINAAALPLEDNSSVTGGAYEAAAREAGCSAKTAKRALKEYLSSPLGADPKPD